MHSLVNRVLINQEGKVFLYALLEEDKIKFRDPDLSKERNVYTDATTERISWYSTMFKHTMKTWPLPIIVTETLAYFFLALLGNLSLFDIGKIFL